MRRTPYGFLYPFRKTENRWHRYANCRRGLKLSDGMPRPRPLVARQSPSWNTFPPRPWHVQSQLQYRCAARPPDSLGRRHKRRERAMHRRRKTDDSFKHIQYSKNSMIRARGKPAVSSVETNLSSFFNSGWPSESRIPALAWCSHGESSQFSLPLKTKTII